MKIIIFLIILFSLWIILKQDLNLIFSYFKYSFELARDYSVAMSIREDNKTLVLAISLLFLTWLSALIAFFPKSKLFKIKKINYYLVSSFFIHLFLVFQSWKHGFVRADGHVVVFLFFAPVYIFTLVLLFFSKKPTTFSR